MKIFYAVQATGNGHISRAKELLPWLQQYGTVDVFLSGSNAQLGADLPVKYRSKGVSLFYSKRGGLDYFKILGNTNPMRIFSEAKALPLQEYDIIFNDFEYITSQACRIQKRNSLQFGHQASFQSKQTPRPDRKDPVGEFILHQYCNATDYLGLHFWPYDKKIVSPVIRQSILKADPQQEGYVTVYLPQYGDAELTQIFTRFSSIPFQIFSKEISHPIQVKNITFIPTGFEAFTQSLIHCNGIITGAGFETPAEALYLRKKVLVVPIKGQYEQKCNAEALKEWGVQTLKHPQHLTLEFLENWLQEKNTVPYNLVQNTAQIVHLAVQSALALG